MALKDEGFTKYSIENRATFEKLIDNAIRQVGDLSDAFDLIADDFYKSAKTIFQLKSPGGYDDLAPDGPDTTSNYKKRKLKEVGFLYPILRGKNKRIETALTVRGGAGAFEEIQKKFMFIGASVMSEGDNPVDLITVHNSDRARDRIPQRKVLFIGPEVKAFHDKDRRNEGGRLTRWGKIIEGTVEEILLAQGFTSA